MMVVLVANTKGGCGKTTVATNLAAALASHGRRTALADADRQRSSLEWARLRPGTAAPIIALDWSKDLTRPEGPRPTGHRCARRDEEEGRIRARAHGRCDRGAGAPSVFDRVHDGLPGAAERAEGGAQEPQARRRAAQRVRARTRASARLAQFLADIEHADLGALPDRAIYNDVAAEGLSIFDLADTRSAALQQDWAPVLGYVALESSPAVARWRRKAEARGRRRRG